MALDEEKLPGLFETFLPEQESILDEESVIDVFTRRVEELMRTDLDLLLSSLYRFDVEEYKIQNALRSPTIPPARGIAMLILDRQKERLKTRKQYSTGKADKWEGL